MAQATVIAEGTRAPAASAGDAADRYDGARAGALFAAALLIAAASALPLSASPLAGAGLCRALGGVTALALGWTAHALRAAHRATERGRARERELLELFRESERARGSAEERLERLGSYSGTVAHDVNNLLSVITLVGSQLRDKLSGDAREYADELCESSLRAGKLNRGLLALAQQAAAEPIAVDLNTVVEAMRRLLARLVGPSLDVVVRLDDRPCIVVAHPVQLERVIVNLVTNARDAMADKGRAGPCGRAGRLTLETAHAMSLDGESVVLRVTDTGSGMDSVTQRLIFEPFFTTKGRSGTGLGLTAVRDIVSGYGGRVDVESRPGVGTSFEILLPVSPVTPAGGTRPASGRSSA